VRQIHRFIIPLFSQKWSFMKLIVDQQELNFPDRWSMTDEEFFDFASQMNDNRIERDKHGNIFIMPPVGFESGMFENDAAFHVKQWALANGGKAINSSIGFILPNNSMRSPDAGWISDERFQKISLNDRKKFPRVCPEFVVEIRSESDRIKALKEKMEEYMENGALLGFLIDPVEQNAYVYRWGKETEVVSDFSGSLSGFDVMPGFELPLSVFKGSE
jgi:Uma2 family endonuclease